MSQVYIRSSLKHHITIYHVPSLHFSCTSHTVFSSFETLDFCYPGSTLLLHPLVLPSDDVSVQWGEGLEQKHGPDQYSSMINIWIPKAPPPPRPGRYQLVRGSSSYEYTVNNSRVSETQVDMWCVLRHCTIMHNAHGLTLTSPSEELLQYVIEWGRCEVGNCLE
jgi:hypothetical protein